MAGKYEHQLNLSRCMLPRSMRNVNGLTTSICALRICSIKVSRWVCACVCVCLFVCLFPKSKHPAVSLAGSQPISEHAAVWIPDHASNVCMHCEKTQFTVLNRKVWHFVEWNRWK